MTAVATWCLQVSSSRRMAYIRNKRLFWRRHIDSPEEREREKREASVSHTRARKCFSSELSRRTAFFSTRKERRYNYTLESPDEKHRV